MMDRQQKDSGTAAIKRAMSLMLAIIRDGDQRSLSDHARRLSIPYSTAHRMVKRMESMGVVTSISRGCYAAGITLVATVLRSSFHDVLVSCAQPLLRRLAQETGLTAHMGVWSAEMVTYLIKCPGHEDTLFTREGAQLEGYCSAIGKVLLAHLDPASQTEYLSAGTFVALTGNTITDVGELRLELGKARRAGYAFDRGEFAEKLHCVAVPIWWTGNVLAAISVSRIGSDGFDAPPEALIRCGETISARIQGSEGGELGM